MGGLAFRLGVRLHAADTTGDTRDAAKVAGFRNDHTGRKLRRPTGGVLLGHRNGEHLPLPNTKDGLLTEPRQQPRVINRRGDWGGLGLQTESALYVRAQLGQGVRRDMSLSDAPRVDGNPSVSDRT